MAHSGIQNETFLGHFPDKWKLHLRCFAELSYFEIVNTIIFRANEEFPEDLKSEIDQYFYRDG